MIFRMDRTLLFMAWPVSHPIDSGLALARRTQNRWFLYYQYQTMTLVNGGAIETYHLERGRVKATAFRST